MILTWLPYYEKPLTKFVRILKSHFVSAPQNWQAFRQAVPLWLKERLWLPYVIEMELRRLGYARPGKFVYPEHHQSHQASAFFPSPFESAATLTADGVGEFDTTDHREGAGKWRLSSLAAAIPAFARTSLFRLHLFHGLQS